MLSCLQRALQPMPYYYCVRPNRLTTPQEWHWCGGLGCTAVVGRRVAMQWFSLQPGRVSSNPSPPPPAPPPNSCLYLLFLFLLSVLWFNLKFSLVFFLTIAACTCTSCCCLQISRKNGRIINILTMATVQKKKKKKVFYQRWAEAERT